MTRLAPQLATRVRAALRRAEHSARTAGTAADWRRQRDAWLDQLHPSHAGAIDTDAIIELIGFLSECAPTASSRLTPAQWEQSISALVPELLYARSSSSTQ